MSLRFQLCLVGLILLIIHANAKFIPKSHQADYCYAEDKNPYLYVGSRTVYPLIHGRITNISVPNCVPLQVWGFFRHGTRYPAGDEIQDIRAILPELRDKIIENRKKRGKGSLCNEDIENFKAWKLNPNVTAEKKKFLSKQGEIDLESIGERFKDSFSNVLFPDESDMSLNDYEFKTTERQRTIESMRFFMKGLFGNRIISHSVRAPTINQATLRPFQACKLWYNALNDLAVNREVNAFRYGPVYEKLIREVSTRLGFSKDLELKTIETIYHACAFEKAWHMNATSPWCAAFTKDHMQALEYQRDLFSYYHMGYGFNLSRQLGCPILHDMFDHFTKLEKGGENEPRGVFLFSHSVSLNLLYTSMSFFEDQTPLTAANYESVRDRKWRTSIMTPYAMNVVAVFYKCESAYKVRFFAGEKSLDYRGCTDGVCDWNYLKEKMGPFANNCQLDQCDN